jgi:hypothetical protein
MSATTMQAAFAAAGYQGPSGRLHTLPRIAETEHLGKKDPAKWTKGRCHNDARRVMTKALLRDLWVSWREMEATKA